MDSVRGSALLPLTMNQYSYCINNPIKYTDIEGMWPKVLHKFARSLKSKAKKAYSKAKTVVKGAYKKIWRAAANVIKASPKASRSRAKPSLGKTAAVYKGRKKKGKSSGKTKRKSSGKTKRKSSGLKFISKEKHFARLKIQEDFNKSYPGGEKQLIDDAKNGRNGWAEQD